ncbi:MAG: hypothetical protein RIT41_1384 [Bacteroidota bacterium]|jgi:6-pyruvoyltetrahydropterin/6-carboxytetrahydropterin synthase
MISVTKIFHFEMAHAIHGYTGACQHIHGHSYELHVCVISENQENEYLPAPGFKVDFKEIKELVHTHIIKVLDHKLILSEAFLANTSISPVPENLFLWQVEPSAENLLHFIQQKINAILPSSIILSKLKLFETKDSYAEWEK